ncbi:F-box domain-containing protein [Madurella fahalii]|uniref:F-box domain-containing protein n=1 Tax=Madurella fahalii TaxID=1157608 RepID=A0ABQ0GHM2_9PEZI
MPSLEEFPDEIIRHILLYLPPEDNLENFQLLSRRLHHLANESLLWRWHCRLSFKYWHPDHRLQEKLAARASSVDWKGLWLTRKRSNSKVARLLDGVLSTKVGQLRRLQQICQMGYDAKDYLLDQCHVDESAEDVLARRYYAYSALDSIHRGVAVDVWCQYQGQALSAKDLDTALGAFDMFVLHDQHQDLDYIVRTFDDLAEQFKHEHPTFEEMSTRQKALSLVRWLRANNLTGMDHPEINYRNLRNCFIGHALSDDQHPSLPIISSAIFTCVAERLDMTAFCLAFPSHVHVAVYAPPGEDLDGNQAETTNDDEIRMCLDPYGSEEEVTLSDLRVRLVEFGWTQGTEAFLSPSPVPIIVQRTAQSIKAAHTTVRDLTDNDILGFEMKRLRSGHPDLNMDAAVYASMWAELLMKQTSSFHWDSNLASFLQKFALSWSEDVWIVKKYLVPLYEKFIASQPNPRPRGGWQNVHEIVGMLDNLDNRVPTVSRRYTEDIYARVRYKIGQVFRHRRYRYIGVINGWAALGSGGLPMPHYLDTHEAEEEGDVFDPTESVHSTWLGPQRTFYTCLKSNVDRLRVAQENIVIITDPCLIPDDLFFVAGKFFKRFDTETCTFVSNIREYYPDD